MFVFPNKPIRVYTPNVLLGVLNPLDTWVVQPKWDGKRVEIAADAKGQITLYGRQGQRFKESWPWLGDLDLPRPWFIDGELLRDGRIFVWDIALMGGTPVYQGHYGPRLARLAAALPAPRTQNGQTIACIETLPCTAYQAILDRKGMPGLEGCVWKFLAAKNLWGPHTTSEVSSQFKFRF